MPEPISDADWDRMTAAFAHAYAAWWARQLAARSLHPATGPGRVRTTTIGEHDHAYGQTHQPVCKILVAGQLSAGCYLGSCPL